MMKINGRGAQPLLHSNLFLYTLCTLIWGSTWFVITLQLKGAPPIASVFWRFLIAGALMLIWAHWKKINLQFSLTAHLMFVSQGVFMFSINYILTYIAETQVSSGLVALAFTTLIYFNMAWMHFAYGKKISSLTIAGTLLGTLGIGLIFQQELARFSFEMASIGGILTSVLATLSASLGNWSAFRIHKMKINVIAGNTWAMLYGTLFTFLTSAVMQNPLEASWNFEFTASLIYLSVFGTVIAFGAYLTLANRIGSERAAFTSVVSPVIALLLSGLFEDFLWTPAIVAGVLLCLIGNYLTLKPSQTSQE